MIPNWRTAELAERAGRALADDGLPMERIVVVDDGAFDVEQLRRSLSGSIVVPVEENVGFARASNLGARTLPGEAYLFVNSDAFLSHPGTLNALLSALGDPGVGIVVPRLLNTDGTVQMNVAPLPSPGVAAVQASGLSRLVPNRWQPRWSTYWRHDATRDVQAATAAAMLVRAETWEALGGFDESRLMYAEDRDLCWRARRAGWRIRFSPDAEFVHLGNASGAARWSSAGRAERVAAAEAAMIRRHRSAASAAATIGFIRAGLKLRIVVSRALGRSPDVFRASDSGYATEPDDAGATPPASDS